MNKLFIFLSLLFSIKYSAQEQLAQDKAPTASKDTSWKTSGFFGLNASQTTLSNWQGGGQDNVTLNGIVNLEAVYKRDKFEQWTNKLDAQFGMMRPGDAKQFRKNSDQ